MRTVCMLANEAAGAGYQQVCDTPYSRDAASRLIGLRLLEARPAYSRLTMRVRPDMVDGYHICHGGYLITLADSAFAYARNSYNRNTVASACHIDFLTTAREGKALDAGCEEPPLSGRAGFCDTAIRNQHDTLTTLFRGKPHRIAAEVSARREAEDQHPASDRTSASAVEGNPQ